MIIHSYSPPFIKVGGGLVFEIFPKSGGGSEFSHEMRGVGKIVGVLKKGVPLTDTY